MGLTFKSSVLNASFVETWQWDFNDGTYGEGDTIHHLFEEPGLYNIKVMAIYGDGECVVETRLKVEVFPIPVADFIFTPTQPILQDPFVQFIDQSQFATSWTWDFGTGDSSDLTNPVYEFAEVGPYSITLYVQNEGGCEDSITKELFVFPEAFIKVPNAFTPDGNGLNDELFLFHAGLIELELYRIYNRWGEMVFETNDISQGWNGTFRGKEQDSGTYVYYVVGRSEITNENIQLKGNFTLIR